MAAGSGNWGRGCVPCGHVMSRLLGAVRGKLAVTWGGVKFALGASKAAARPLRPTVAPELIEERLRLFEVGRVEAFGEPAVDRREQVASFGAAALVATEPGNTRGGAQFPELGLLLLGNA